MARQRVVWSPEKQRFVPEGTPPRPSGGGGRPAVPPRAAKAVPAAAPSAGDHTKVQSRPKVRPASPSPPPAAAPSPSPQPETGGARPRRTRRRRPWLRRLILIALALVVLVVGGLLFFAKTQFDRIEKVPVAEVLSPAGGGGTNYLIVGSDSREGITTEDPNSGAFLDQTPAPAQTVLGERTDTILLLRIESGRTVLTSIPRDLWVQNAVTGDFGRINSTYQTGPDALIRTVQNLGIPVHHYLEIDFVSFGSLVDAVGGITIDFPYPARDSKSGLDVPVAGPVTLDGTQALAFVRSRAYTELVDGVWRTDPTGDIGRTERQRQFLTTLMGAVGSTRNPLNVSQIAGSVGGGLKIDDSLGFFEALRLGWRLKGLAPESVQIPVYGRTTSGGAAVLELEQPAAAEVIAGLGG